MACQASTRVAWDWNGCADWLHKGRKIVLLSFWNVCVLFCLLSQRSEMREWSDVFESNWSRRTDARRVGGRAKILWARMNFGEEGGRALVGGFDSAPWENTRPACCKMAPQWRPFERELIDSLCHVAHLLWVWRYMKRTTLRGRGQSQSTNTPLCPKPPEKKAAIYFAVTHTERDHVAPDGGMLIMLSEEDGRMLSLSLRWRQGTRALSRCELAYHRLLKSSARCFFSQITGRKKTEGREGQSRSLKRKLTMSAERQDWNARSASNQPRWVQRHCGKSRSVTYSAWVSSACRGFPHVLQWRRGICNNVALKFALLVRLS